MEIYLVRHTTPLIENGICYGQSDIPLSATFEMEVTPIVQSLPSDIDAVYSSPLSRCVLLAKRIPSKELIIDNNLLEMNFGEWELKKWDDVDQKTLNHWMQDFVNVRVPGGESFVDLYERVCLFMVGLSKLPYQRIVVVTHAGVIRSAMANMQTIPLKESFKYKVEYGSVTKIFTSV